MAKTRDIRTRVAFEGETEYKKVVSDIAAEHKKLNNELKAAQAEFKATGNAEKMFEEKSKILNKQIEAQNKAIKTAEDALKKLKDNGVEKSSAAWVHWEKELTSAKTAMFNATAELNKLNSEFGNVTNATERATQETADYSETLKSIDKGVKFQNVLNGLKIVKDAVGGVISTALRMGKALVMSQISGGDWAREIMMGAAKAGVSIEEYQARLYAQAVGGINTDAITEGVKKTTENLATTDTELLKLYNDLGISTRNADGTVRDATETFWASVDALKAIEDQTTRSIYAQKLLGDQYLELRGLVDLGSEGYEKLIEEGKASATVTEDSVKALSDMDAAVEKVNSTAETLKHNVQSQLAPGFAEVANAFSSMMQNLNEFIQSEEGQEVFAKWNAELSGIASSIRNANLADLFSKAADTASALTDALQWLTANGEGVKYWLLAIGGAFKTIQVSTDVLTFLLLIKNAKDLLGKKAATSAQLGAALPIKTILEDVNKTINKEMPIHSRTYDKDGNLIAMDQHDVNFYNEGLIGAGGSRNQSSKERANDITARAEELKAIIKALETETDFEKAANKLDRTRKNADFSKLFEFNEISEKVQSFVSGVNEGSITNSWQSLSALFEIEQTINATMSAVAESAESGGGGAMAAFNAAIEKGTADTKDTLKSGVTAAFSGFDSVFASMGAAHGAAYINALSAQMSRINSLLSLSPSYAYGGTFYNPAQSAYASPTSTANVSLYVGREKFGQVTTPIIDARMGADLMTVR